MGAVPPQTVPHVRSPRADRVAAPGHGHPLGLSTDSPQGQPSVLHPPLEPARGALCVRHRPRRALGEASLLQQKELQVEAASTPCRGLSVSLRSPEASPSEVLCG